MWLVIGCIDAGLAAFSIGQGDRVGFAFLTFLTIINGWSAAQDLEM